MKVVYTSIFSNYEELKEPTIVSEGWRYVCFTDQPFKSDVWEIVPSQIMGIGPQRTARYYKICFHKFIDAEYSMWVDGSFHINCDLNKWWDLRFKEPFSCAQHPLRNCIYHEARSCIVNKRGDVAEINNQINKYKKLRLPERNGIITSGILLRQRTPEVMEFCEKWYNELSEQSVRDQMAYAFVSHQTGFKANTYKWDYSQSKEFIYKKHYKLRR